MGTQKPSFFYRLMMAGLELAILIGLLGSAAVQPAAAATGLTAGLPIVSLKAGGTSSST